MLKIENLYAGYSKVDPILENISFEIKKGEIVLITGRNGVGKSTLAKAIINNIPYLYGKIIFNNTVVFESGKKALKTNDIVNLGIGYFLQGGRVFPQLTVEENLILSNGMKDFQKTIVFNKFNKHFGFLEKNLKEKATYLSLGQKHLLAFGMVLNRDPEFLILDEPTAGLDEKNTEIVTDIIDFLKNDKNFSILLIEHRTEEIRVLADRRIEIDDKKIVNIV